VVVGAFALASSLAVVAETSRAALERGRERLLAGWRNDAASSLRRAARWPGTARRARAGLAVLEAEAGRTATPPSLQDLRPFDPVGLVEWSVERGDLSAAEGLGRLLRRAGHPLGPMYAAALALDHGDEAGARELARSSPVPLGVRSIGVQVQEALGARAAGAMTLAWDRRGVLVGTVGPEGLRPAPGLEPLVAGWRSHLPSIAMARAGRDPDLRLTIDLDLSRLAQGALGDTRGTIVLLEPRTGALLAAVSDARTRAREGNAAFAQQREPASIAKILTTSAAYRAGIDPDREIRGTTCTGVEKYGGRPLWCPSPAGHLAGLDQALAVSCNIAFANLGQEVGAARLEAEYRLWGFDGAEGALMGAAGHVLLAPRGPRELADLAIGLEDAEITPLHAALLATVIADGGRMPTPHLVTGRCGGAGLDDRPFRPAADREVLPSERVPRLRRAMEAVARVGTAAGLAPPGLVVAMKTGTAALYRAGYHVNYIGIAPSPDASVAFCVRLTHFRSSYAVTVAAREVTRRLLAGLAERRDALDRAARRQRSLWSP
jgi:peptidoglycan glycosyltransferase